MKKFGKRVYPSGQSTLWRRFWFFSGTVLFIYLFLLCAYRLFPISKRKFASFPPYHFSNATCGSCDFAFPELVDTHGYRPFRPRSSESPCHDFIDIEATGRLGNLMFEYATVVGICVRRGLDPTSCARITEPFGANASSSVLPLAEFKREFRVTAPICSVQPSARGVYVEHAATGTSGKNVDYDEYATHAPLASTLKGYFQSHLYFYPHADQFIRKSFAFSTETVQKASTFFDKIIPKVQTAKGWLPQEYALVCMAVRRGDKTNKRASPIYNKWALSAEYYRRALRHVQDKHSLKKFVVVVFVGGSFKSEEDVRDRAWVDAMIRIPHSNPSVYFLDDLEIAMHSYASMKAISMCPNIIIGSSSFAWWAAYLSNHANVVAPKTLYSSRMNFVPLDYYPASWTLLEEPKVSFAWYKKEGSPLALEAPPKLPDPDLSQLGGDLTTVVSSYYKIPSKYNHTSTYVKWMAHFMSMNFKCVIFVDSASHKELAATWPATSRRKYIVREIADFESGRVGTVNWTAHERLDPELHVGHNALLYQLWSEKIFMVGHVVETNPFQTDTFAWTDIGAFRDPSRLSSLKGYPDPTRFNTNKVTFPQIEHFTSCETENFERIDRRFLDKIRIGGGHFAGSSDALLRFRELYREILQESFDEDVFIGKDQSMFAFLILRHPSLFDTVKPSWCPGHYDIWFCIQYHWSSGGEPVTTYALPPQVVLSRESPVTGIAETDRVGQCSAMLLILSTRQSQRYRMAVREGWINSLFSLYPRFNFQYKFILGRDETLERRFGPHGTAKFMRKEIDAFQDVEILPFLDTYLNLTMKVALMLKWAVVAAPSCRYIFKIDEDVVLRPLAFAHFTTSILPSNGDSIYGGHVYDQKKRISAPSRDPQNRNSLSVASFPFAFSPYAAGPMYFLSSSLVKRLPYGVIRVDVPQGRSTIIEAIPDFYWRARFCPLYSLEDAFFGHMLWNMTDVRIVHVKNWFPITTPSSQHPRLFALWGIKNPDMIKRLSHVDEVPQCVPDHALLTVRGEKVSF